MTTKIASYTKHLGLACLVFFAIVSCEKEIENIGTGLIETKFETNAKPYSVFTEGIEIANVPANGIGEYLLGVYYDEEFGEIKASIVSRLYTNTTGTSYDYGDNATIDSVILSIPLIAKSDATTEIDTTNIIGNLEKEFELNVYRLQTYFNDLDPTDPSINQIYYSDKEFAKSDDVLYSDNFLIEYKDTIIVKRYLENGELYDKDTIAVPTPTIKIGLDEDLIKTLFMDASSDNFISQDVFQEYFRGLYIEANVADTNESFVFPTTMASANMTIYYSNDQDEGTETGEGGIDLNDNDINGEGIVRVPEEFVFNCYNGYSSNVIERDYSSIIRDSDRLYVQGAAGEMATIELFPNGELDVLKTENFLITDAKLTFYIDVDASSDIYPDQLFLYNYDEDLQILDAISESLTSLGGYRDYEIVEDDDGNNEVSYLNSYTFKITDYISELIQGDQDLVKLGLKVYNTTDNPIINSAYNYDISKYSWNPKGVVLYDHSESHGDKKIKLEINYTDLID